MKELQRKTRRELIELIERLQQRLEATERPELAGSRSEREGESPPRADRLADLYERERQLIAYEIHDGLAQKATAALLQLQAYRGMQGRDPEEAQGALDEAATCLRQSIDEARRLIRGLLPPDLDKGGLLPAIGRLVAEVRARAGLDVEFSYSVPFDRLASPLEHAVFRIVQEALTNAERHSGSDKVRIRLVRWGDLVRVEVEDQGIGFDPGKLPPGRFGVRGIQKRAELLGGRAVIRSRAGEGTRVIVELPLVA